MTPDELIAKLRTERALNYWSEIKPGDTAHFAGMRLIINGLTLYERYRMPREQLEEWDNEHRAGGHEAAAADPEDDQPEEDDDAVMHASAENLYQFPNPNQRRKTRWGLAPFSYWELFTPKMWEIHEAFGRKAIPHLGMPAPQRWWLDYVSYKKEWKQATMGLPIFVQRTFFCIRFGLVCRRFNEHIDLATVDLPVAPAPDRETIASYANFYRGKKGCSWQVKQNGKNPYGEAWLETISRYHGEAVSKIIGDLRGMQQEAFVLHHFGLGALDEQPRNRIICQVLNFTLAPNETFDGVGAVPLHIREVADFLHKSEHAVRKTLRRVKDIFMQHELPDPVSPGRDKVHNDFFRMHGGTATHDTLANLSVKKLEGIEERVRREFAREAAAKRKRDAKDRKKRKEIFGPTYFQFQQSFNRYSRKKRDRRNHKKFRR